MFKIDKGINAIALDNKAIIKKKHDLVPSDLDCDLFYINRITIKCLKK